MRAGHEYLTNIINQILYYLRGTVRPKIELLLTFLLYFTAFSYTMKPFFPKLMNK